MRNIHLRIRSEYGIENVGLFQQLEGLECKMADLLNHRRFLLRCLSVDIIPVSIRLKSNIRTPKGCSIIKKAERALLNERIRSIYNTITMSGTQRDTCKYKLSGILDKETIEECVKFINYIRETKQIKTLERQTLKFNQLCHKNTGGHSNIHHGEHGDHNHKQQQERAIATPVSEKSDVQKAKWVIGISCKPLTTVQLISPWAKFCCSTERPT